MYVRRWPRISASSRTPPSDMRTNSRPMARAIDSPIEVLPVPGGPIRVRIAPERLSACDAALLAQLLDGDVLDDAVLDVLQAGVVGVEHLAGADRVEAAPRSARPTARRSASRGRCGSSGASPDCSPVRSRRSSSRSACSRTASGMPASSILVRYSSTTEPSSSPSSRRIDSICLRRKYSRCCFWAPDSTSSRMRAADLQLGRAARAGCSRASSRRSVTSSGLEQLDLLLEGQVGGVAGGVGQRAGLGDRAQERGRRGRRRRAARGSPRPRRGTRARASRVRPSTGTSSGALGRPRRAGCRAASVEAAPATPRATPSSAAPRTPPGRRTRSATRAIVPTVAYSPSWRGTSRRAPRRPRPPAA